MFAGAFELTKVPAPPGVTFRRFKGEADYAAIAHIMNASNAGDQIEETTRVEDVANELAHLSNCDPADDFVFADADGKTVGFSRVHWRINGEGQRIYWQSGFIVPEWRREGIGSAMLGYTEGRARLHARAHPIPGASLLQGVGEDTAYGKIALFERAGYTPARYFFFMQRKDLHDLPDAPLPRGIELIPAQPEHMRAIWNAKEEAFRDHWGYASKAEADYQHWLNDPVNDLGLWQIAWDVNTNQVAGMSLNMINYDDNRQYNFLRGWVISLAVRRPWRGRGLARALLVNSLRILRERGMAEAVLAVDGENLTGALRLYEGVGFRVLNKDALYRKPLE